MNYVKSLKANKFELMHIVNFLAKIAPDYQPASLKSFKAIILSISRCLFPDLIEKGSNVIKMMKQVVRGLSKIGSTRSKDISWDTNVVWKAIMNIECPTEGKQRGLQDAIDFTVKGFILLMLATGCRVNELVQIDRSKLVFSNSECMVHWEFRRLFLRKFERVDKPFVTFPIHGLQGLGGQCSRLCPVDWLSSYLNYVKADSDDRVIFVHPKLKRPLSGRWLAKKFKEFVKRTNLTARNPVSHDLRRVAASVAYIARALPLEEILARGSWGSENVFFEHYLRLCRTKYRLVVLGKVAKV